MEEIKNDIDKLDGMMKIKGKCGYEIIGGCSDLRRLKQENAELKENNTVLEETLQTIEQLKDEDSLRIAQLVTENAELKELKCKFKEYCTCDTERYRSALEEIRGIAGLARSLPCGNDCTFPKCYDSITRKGKYCMFHRLEEIKERINEVLND